MKNFLLLCIVWTLTAFTGIALAVPPPPPHHHYAPHHNCSYKRYHYNRPTVYINQPRFTVYGNSYRKPYTTSYCLTRNNSAYDVNCEREKRFMPNHSTAFYGF